MTGSQPPRNWGPPPRNWGPDPSSLGTGPQRVRVCHPNTFWAEPNTLGSEPHYVRVLGATGVRNPIGLGHDPSQLGSLNAVSHPQIMPRLPLNAPPITPQPLAIAHGGVGRNWCSGGWTWAQFGLATLSPAPNPHSRNYTVNPDNQPGFEPERSMERSAGTVHTSTYHRHWANIEGLWNTDIEGYSHVFFIVSRVGRG